MNDARTRQTRSQSFLARTSALADASFLGMPRIAAAKRPPEITRIRLGRVRALCFAMQYVADALLGLKGFSEVEYVEQDQTLPATLSKSADLAMFGAATTQPTRFAFRHYGSAKQA